MSNPPLVFKDDNSRPKASDVIEGLQAGGCGLPNLIDADELIMWLEGEMKGIKKAIISKREMVKQIFPDELKEDCNHTIDLSLDIAVGIVEETIKKIKEMAGDK